MLVLKWQVSQNLQKEVNIFFPTCLGVRKECNGEQFSVNIGIWRVKSLDGSQFPLFWSSHTLLEIDISEAATA